jgi:DNA polymerase I
MRSFMVFPTDTIGCYLDWKTQEVAVAAALSGDEALRDAYLAGDIYYDLARICGLTNDPDRKRWKDQNPEVRSRMKALQLAIGYGMGVPSLAKGLDRHPLVASAIIEKHRQAYPRFWQWRADMVQTAMLDRRIESAFGWPLRISSSPNKRTLYNFPMQSNGAEMLRLAAWRLCEAGIVPNMLIHDGILIEARSKEEIAHTIEIMRAAGRDVCNGLEVGVDVDQMLEAGARYRDKRPVAKQMWDTIMNALREVALTEVEKAA